MKKLSIIMYASHTQIENAISFLPENRKRNQILLLHEKHVGV